MSTSMKEKREPGKQEQKKVQDKITPQQIAERAYQLWLEHGCENGHDVEDWLQAEDELTKA